MKFAKELEDDLVPEWRLKYLDYKGGKKRIKAVTRALKTVSKTPQMGGGPSQHADNPNGQFQPLPFTHFDFAARSSTRDLSDNATANGQQGNRPDPARRESLTLFAKSPPVLIPNSRIGDSDNVQDMAERQPLNISVPRGEQLGRRGFSYGSIVGTPPYASSPPSMSRLELPDPAINSDKGKKPLPSPSMGIFSPRTLPRTQSPPDSTDPYQVGRNKIPHKLASTLPHQFLKKTANGSQKSKNTFPQSKLRRMFSTAGLESPAITNVQLDAYRELDAKQEEFFQFLDKELDKIEKFYKAKEQEATDRLRVLREQLHELRDRRMDDIKAAKEGKRIAEEGLIDGLLPITAPVRPGFKRDSSANGYSHSLLKPIEYAAHLRPHIGKTSEAMENLGSPTHPRAKDKVEGKKDYVRRNNVNEKVPYRFAKRRLKLALQEFYRALELLKSYALLNRTGFRKINKKYDKAANSRPTLRYMTEKVNNAYFVKSNVIEGHIVAVEDLYARYFERGNHKIAVGKLRTKLKHGDQSQPSFRNGLWLAAGTALGIQGIVYGANHLYSDNPTIAVQTSYLLQLYAGYFLALLLFLMFVIDCKIWTAARINYVFIFEYDTRDVLDWRQLAELPCFFYFLDGLFIWLNFRQPTGTDSMFLYWPLALIATTLVIMCLPFPILYPQARKWWGFSNWRLCLAGLYPVEFRDFFLGDMYCSQTYAMSQIEVFFCLYVNDWVNPPQCNSNHSRLLGFFTTLPAIWRALQCLRRYYDSKNWFPHLANFAKYCCNILYYMSLSIYRIQINSKMRAMFIVFAFINAIYCSFWDVAMDFSLGNPYSRHPFLRDNLGYRKVWVYYVAMVLDVILRQQWIFYAMFTHNLQHSAVMSFAIGLAEVLRRGLWSLFRVENEHCNNVGKFRASRDIDLPYSLPGSPEGSEHPSPQTSRRPAPDAATVASGVDLERSGTSDTATSSTLRRRASLQINVGPGIKALQRVGTVIASAHAQDFEKKKRPDGERIVQDPRSGHTPHQHRDSSDEDEDGDEDEDDDEGASLDGDMVSMIGRASPRMGDDEEELLEAQKMLSRGRGEETE